jgi:hypothetical protein
MTTDDKKTPELLETSVIYIISLAVGALGFLLIWVICILAGLGSA